MIKDYVKIAAILAKYRNGGDNDWHLLVGEDVASINDLTRDFADFLASDNPRFNRERFYRACGQED